MFSNKYFILMLVGYKHAIYFKNKEADRFNVSGI